MDSLINAPEDDFSDIGFSSSEVSPLRERRVPGLAAGTSARDTAGKKSYEIKLADGEKLDNAEQDELISDLRAQAAFMAKIWRLMMIAFGGIFFTFGAGMLLLRAVRGPQAVYLHRTLEPSIGVALFTILQLFVLLSYALTTRAAVALPRASEEHMLASGVAAAVAAILFLSVLAVKGRMGVDNAWLPLCAAAQWCGTWYARYSARALDKEVGALDGVRYRHESL
jgi:hypothetical protein